jgi:CBS-domain-containing membrane protein
MIYFVLKFHPGNCEEVRGMQINQCMKQNVVSIAHSASVRRAAQLFVAHHIGTLPVIDDEEQLVGILHLRDLLRLVMPTFIDLVDDFDYVLGDFGDFELLRPSSEAAKQPISQLMEPPVSVAANCGLLRAFAIVMTHDLYDLPVVDADERLVGLASRVDIGTALLANWQNES